MMPMKSTKQCLESSQQKRDSTAESSKKYTKSSTYRPKDSGYSNLVPKGLDGSVIKLV
jgi:hypothetical protein